MTEFPEVVKLYSGLSEDSSLFKSIFEEARDAMLLIDDKGRVKEMNYSMKSFLRDYYGTTGDSFNLFNDELIPDDIKIVLKQLLRPGNTSGEIKIEGRSPVYARKNTRILRDFDYHARAVSCGRNKYLLITVRDSRDRNLLEKRLLARIKQSGLINELLIKLSGTRELWPAMKIIIEEIVAATSFTCGCVLYKLGDETLKTAEMNTGEDYPEINNDILTKLNDLLVSGSISQTGGKIPERQLSELGLIDWDLALFELNIHFGIKFILLFGKPKSDSAADEDRKILPTALSRCRIILKRIHAESELKTERLKLDNIFNRSRLGIYITTMEGRFLTMNAALIEMLGYSGCDEINESIVDIGSQIYVDKDFRKSMIAKIREEKLENYSYETPFRRKDGTVFIARVNMSIVKNTANSAEFLEGFVEDITEQRKREKNLKLLNKELERRVSIRTSQLENANKELETFAYSVSHDLRAPLRSIDGFAQAMEEDFGTELDNIAVEYLARIKGAANKMSMIIDDMLKLSRITRSDMKFAPVNISELAKGIIDELRQNEPDRIAEISIDKNILVSGDINLLRIALDNLLGNAWKFTSKKEITRIAIRRAKDANALEIEDNGAGFDMKYYNKLFNPFQRLHKDDEFEGTGIGLATVKRIISKHGGSIQANSRLNEGTVFTIYLPNNNLNNEVMRK